MLTLNSRKREDGFTLIELLVVIIIIGILAAIAIPLFLDQRKLAVDANVKSDVRSTVDNIVTATAANTSTDPLTVPPVKTAGLGARESVKVAADPSSTGDYVVYGYDTDGKNLTGYTSAFTFKSKTGQFTTSDVSVIANAPSADKSTGALAVLDYEGSDSPGFFNSWSPSTDASMQTVTEEAATGTHSSKFYLANGFTSQLFLRTDNFNLTQGQSYTVSYWAKAATGSNGTNVMTQFYGSSSATVYDNISGTDWKRHTITFVPNSNSTTLDLYIAGFNTTAYMDNFQLRPTN
jgi:type IV pilus assembly protein PilA